MDKQRTLYLVAYDSCNRRRLRRVCRYLTGYKVSGQKSVFEIWATDAELREIRDKIKRLIRTDEDRLHILALDPRMPPHGKGRARCFEPKFFSIV